MSFLT